MIIYTQQALLLALGLGAVLGACTAVGTMATVRLLRRRVSVPIRRRVSVPTIQRLAGRRQRCKYCGDPTPTDEPICGICAFFVREVA